MSTLEKRIVDVIEVIAKEIKRREIGLASKEQKANLDIQEQFEKIENNHNEVTSSLANKAEKSELEQLKPSVEAGQEQIQTQSEKINTKLDESQVKALIAEAELDDLTLEQVQEEVIKRVADKASTQAVNEANQAQDAKIGEVEQSLADKANAVHTHTVDDIRDINEKFYKMFEDETYVYRFSQLVEMAVGGYVEILEDLQSKYFSMGDVRNAINEAIREERSAREQAFVSDLNVLRQKVESLESARGIVSRQVDRNSRGTDNDDEEMVTLEM